jgi:hypothetical protein
VGRFLAPLDLLVTETLEDPLKDPLEAFEMRVVEALDDLGVLRFLADTFEDTFEDPFEDTLDL